MMSQNSETEPEARRGLAVRPANRLHRQTGKSNLLALENEHVFKTRAIAAIPPKDSQATVTHTNRMSYATKSKSKTTFEVFEDNPQLKSEPQPDDKENNVIHLLEKQCKKEVPEPEVPKRRGLVEKKQIKIEVYDECSSVRSAGASTTCTIRGDLSNLGIDVEEESGVLSSINENDPESTCPTEYKTAPDRLDYTDAIYCAPEFDEDVYKYMKAREIVVRARPNYLAKQPTLSQDMRCILIDWLHDVVIEYKMQQETLHLAVNIVDRTLSRFRVDKWKLQLVGATAMLIASKFEEIYPPELKEFVYLTDDSYTSKQFLQMEVAMLNELKFEVSAPTTAWFARRLAKFANAEKTTQYAMEYLVDLTLLDLNFLTFRPSYIAAACLCYANLLTDCPLWTPALQEVSGIEPRSLDNILTLLHRSFVAAPREDNKHRSMYTRYAESTLCSVSMLPPPAELPL